MWSAAREDVRGGRGGGGCGQLPSKWVSSTNGSRRWAWKLKADRVADVHFLRESYSERATTARGVQKRADTTGPLMVGV